MVRQRLFICKLCRIFFCHRVLRKKISEIYVGWLIYTLVLEAFLNSLLANFVTRTAFVFLLARSALRPALCIANFQIKKVILKESLWDQGNWFKEQFWNSQLSSFSWHNSIHSVTLYNNQINARALIGQSVVGYCAGKPTEKSRVFWIII